jgi:hypothetical protein
MSFINIFISLNYVFTLFWCNFLIIFSKYLLFKLALSFFAQCLFSQYYSILNFLMFEFPTLDSIQYLSYQLVENDQNLMTETFNFFYRPNLNFAATILNLYRFNCF